MRKTSLFKLEYQAEKGLLLNWLMPNGLHFEDVPIRVILRGHGLFRVWSAVDSGENTPVWAEEGLELAFFGPADESPKSQYTVEELVNASTTVGYRVTARGSRAGVVLELLLEDDELRVKLTVDNPPGAVHFPLCETELRFESLSVGPNGYFLNAHAYGGNTHGYGRLAELEKPGVPFIHGCIGQALPLVYLHDGEDSRGVQFEIMMDGRPTAWLTPGATPEQVNWCMTWGTERLLQPGQSHVYGGTMGILPYTGRAVEQMRRWRDAAATRYGLLPPKKPAWIRHANAIFFNMNPDQAMYGFKNLADPKCRAMLKRWSDMGFTAIYSVSDNNVGMNWLSPYDYEPRPDVGGESGERQMLEWAHEFGLNIYLWVTTVGVDRNSRLVPENPDWFTHRINGDLFYAWESHPPLYLGYAPDADPTSRGWREWLKGQAQRVIERGFDGIFVDGLIPRASNHARWFWPGEGRNSVQDQVMELAGHVRETGRKLGREVVTVVEDESLMMQVTCDVTTGRYNPVPPHFKKAYWDHGMGGGPDSVASEPEIIPPEMARHYLLVRYASLLPGVLSNDGICGFQPGARPWSVQSMLAGMVGICSDSFFEGSLNADLDDMDLLQKEEKIAYRRKIREQYIQLVQFCHREKLVHEAPMSIEGVVIEGDNAVVGILRPGGDRAIMALIQFADRPCTVQVRLAPPVDVVAFDAPRTGAPEKQNWRVHELLHSADDEIENTGKDLAPGKPLKVNLSPFGFRIYELIK